MEDDAGDFPFLTESARRFVALLATGRAFKREDENEDQDRQRGAALIRHIDYTISGLEARISETEDEYDKAANEVDRREAVKKMRLLAGYAHFMRRALPWLEDAKDPPLELGALYFIDRLSEALLGERADVVPTRADEYSTEQRPFEPLLKDSLGISTEKAAIRPVILNFPALEADSFPLLPLFGHELGHTAVIKGDLAAAALASASTHSEFVKALTAATQALVNQMNLSEKRARIIVNERLEDWTVELLCDQLAMQHLGPSYLLAFAAYLVPLSWNAPGPRHPPTTVRIAHLLHWIEGTAWESLLAQRLPTSLTWLKHVAAAQRPVQLAPSLSLLLDAVDLARGPISAVVHDYLGPHVYKANGYLAHAKHLDELLRYEILPVQHPATGKAFESRAILVAGWLSVYEEAAKSDKKQSPATLCRALRQTKSHAFFTKALEVSSVLDMWGKVA